MCDVWYWFLELILIQGAISLLSYSLFINDIIIVRLLPLLAADDSQIITLLNTYSSFILQVEGEIDKLVIEEAGFDNYASVPDGAPPASTKDLPPKENK